MFNFDALLLYFRVFGDFHVNTIEETWYKAAVLQHMLTNESLVIATPLPVLDEIIENPPKVENDDGDITIRVSYAIFYKDDNYKTPASVVGFEFSYLQFYERFQEITNVSTSGTKVRVDVIIVHILAHITF